MKWLLADGKTWHYGIARHMDEKDKRKYPGQVIVDDPVYPKCYAVNEKDLVDIEPSYGTWNQKTGDFEGGDELTQYVRKHYWAARDLEESLTGKGVVAHRLFGIGVADGTAWYTVTNVNRKKKTCTVEWRGYCPDRWTDHWFGWGRKNVAFADVESYLTRGECRRKFFDRNRKVTQKKAAATK